jgi:hypothetical protein
MEEGAGSVCPDSDCGTLGLPGRFRSGNIHSMKRIYLRFLISEILMIGAVALIFRTIPDRVLAGVVAGTLFVSLGLWILVLGLVSIKSVDPDRRFWHSATFWAGCAHLFLTSLPLMITRLLNWSTSFEQVDVLGLPGPVFHRLSTTVFSVLILATAFDLWRSPPETRA